MKMIIKNTLILLAIALVSSVTLSFVYEVTKAPIARAEQQKKAQAYQQVYTDAQSFDTVEGIDDTLAAYNDSLTDGSSVAEILAANDAGGNTLGYVLTVNSTKGYGGDITLALGIDRTGKVVGYAVLSHSESPGFGANCANADVREQFIGITAADQIDGISGATFTTEALRAETQAAIDLVKRLGGEGV